MATDTSSQKDNGSTTGTTTGSNNDSNSNNDNKKRPFETMTTKTIDATDVVPPASVLPSASSAVAATAPAKSSKKNKDPKLLQIRRTLQLCCKTNDLHQAMQVYEQSKEDGIRLEPQSCYNLLNLCDGLGDRPLHVGTPKGGLSTTTTITTTTTTTTTTTQTLQKHNAVQTGSRITNSTHVDKDIAIGNTRVPTMTTTTATATTDAEVPTVEVDADTRLEYAFTIKKDMDEWKFPLNETAYTALIRMLSKAGRVEEANHLLREAEQTQQCKMRLRLYSSLLAAYCDRGNMPAALNVWIRLTQQQQLIMTEREYASLIKCAVLTGSARYMERFLSELAEDILVPCKETNQTICDWFQSVHAIGGKDDDKSSVSSPTNVVHTNTTHTHTTTTLEPPPPPCTVPSMGPVVTSTSALKWIIDSGCTVDAKGTLQTGCLKGHVLQPVPLSLEASEQMMAYNETIVLQGMVDGDSSIYAGGGKGKKRQRGNAKQNSNEQNWTHFKEFLEQTYPMSTLSSSSSSTLSSSTWSSRRLDVCIDGANIGYYKQNFAHAPKHVDYRQIDVVVQHFVKQNKNVLLVLHARHFSSHLMPSWAIPIVEGWKSKSILYKAPPGMNDDWFWLHAALWASAFVVTNDEMRDHFFQMLTPRSFLRWKERHQIRFSFTPGHRQLELFYPNMYSRRVQRVDDGLVIPLCKRGDENRFLDGVHVANDDEPEEETYLCIRPTSQLNEAQS